jgi:hypothetical protein
MDLTANPDWVTGLGSAAFDSYVESVGGWTHDDKPIPPWSDLTDRVRAGWIEAGKGAVRRALDLGIVTAPDQSEV